MRTRKEIGRNEATGNPIYLFQWRSDKRAHWQTETVFYTREEAEEWGRNHHYRWPHWQVYCVHATGELCDVLRMPETIGANA